MSSPVPPAIANAYDPDRFRADGHRLVDALADQLAAWQRREGAVLPWRAPAEARAAWGAEPLEGGDVVADLLRIARASTALAHPHYMAHQVPPPLPSAALAELTSALLNNGMAVYEMGPAAVPIELAVVEWVRKVLGLADGAAGLLTSGGSLGNLTALLAMRQATADDDVWARGAHAGPPLAVIASSDAHYSVARALRIMGWGDGGLIAVAPDERRRLTGSAVEAALARAGDRKVIGIVAAAGSTAVGAFDPLDELADVAERHGLWLHVDAAHGGSAALSALHRDKLRGLARADSVVWDAHKLFMMPALITAVMFRRGAHAYAAFAQQASYLYAADAPEHHWWDMGTRTLECTKRMMAVAVWTALRAHGERLFGDVVDRLAALGAALAARLRAAPDFELALEPELDIVCYRHRPAGAAPGPALDAHNRALRQRIVEDGRFYIVGTELSGAQAGYWLRSAFMNPLIEEADIDALLEHVRALGGAG